MVGNASLEIGLQTYLLIEHHQVTVLTPVSRWLLQGKLPIVVSTQKDDL